jgi:hypothetical protein
MAMCDIAAEGFNEFHCASVKPFQFSSKGYNNINEDLP